MLPVIAIVGRPNVGKSTLFNRLTGTRNALVGDMSGLTRDRQYGEGVFEDRHYILIDTGGLNTEKSGMETMMAEQAWQAVAEADVVLFLVDARSHVTTDDALIARMLRKRNKNVYLTVNKIDGLNKDTVLADFYSLGFAAPYPISAEHGTGIKNLISTILETIPHITNIENTSDIQKNAVKIAIIGRPNAGKSTLINSILGEKRVIVSDEPGTTRDSIFINFTRHKRDYILIDTAGVRRKSRIKEKIENFSVIKTLQAIQSAQVVVTLIDAQEGIADQDLWLLNFALQAGKALVIGVNKWDKLSAYERKYFNQILEGRLSFVDFAEVLCISALKNQGVGRLFTAIDEAYRSTSCTLKTPELTRLLEKIIDAHPPIVIKKRRIKLRYAHPGGKNPPLIVIHGNQVDAIPPDYARYLASAFRKALHLTGTPIRIEFKQGSNPYKTDKPNKPFNTKKNRGSSAKRQRKTNRR